MNQPTFPGFDHEGESSAHGITDLMTSLAVIFILLLAAYVTREETPRPPNIPSANQSVMALQKQLPPHRPAVAVQSSDPDVLNIVVPDTMLNFEFGKSVLLPSGETFLSETMPDYAAMICGAEGKNVASFVIEGHTDDRGDDLHNLKLSQERSFAVMVKALEIIRVQLPSAYDCFQKKTSANGRGEQDLIVDEDGLVDRGQSRRVVFKIYLHPV
ncbi:MAG TPA: OmpA family protein [Nitrospira sp.]|nr:OmpA family protein [Nitrospira sp.]